MRKIIKGRDRTRELVRIRDRHLCQDCGQKWEEGKRKFDIHHLNGLCGKKSRSYDKVSDMEGLVTLCHKCHFNRPEHTMKSEGFGVSTIKIKEMESMYKERYTLREIGEKYKISRQRVHQLLKKLSTVK